MTLPYLLAMVPWRRCVPEGAGDKQLCLLRNFGNGRVSRRHVMRTGFGTDMAGDWSLVNLQFWRIAVDVGASRD
jgi:hypothetical protein